MSCTRRDSRAKRFNGPASLQIVSDDQGNTGTGGPLTDTDTVIITVTAPNQNTTITNQAVVDPDNLVPEGDEENNSDTADTTIQSVINLKITKEGPEKASQSELDHYKIHVKNEMSSGTETGAAVGAMLGALLFVVFPPAIIGGAIIGGLIGRAAAPGIDGDFVKQVEADLPVGGSALFLLTKGGDPGLLIAAMRQYKGRVVQTSLDSEEEQALRDSLK